MFHLGTSGWYYNHWGGRFYPADLPKADWLPYYCTKFDTVEINASFYRLPSERMVEGWRTKTPASFRFAVKGSRVITHLKKLQGVDESLAIFYDRVSGLSEKLSVILWQLPPFLTKDLERLEGFLRILTHRWPQCIEFRHKSWLSDDVFALLARYSVGFCIVSSPSLPAAVRVTAPFAYLRWHGGTLLYASNYSPAELRQWAETIRSLPVNEVFGYFNNDAMAFAPKNCLQLRQMLEGVAP